MTRNVITPRRARPLRIRRAPVERPAARELVVEGGVPAPDIVDVWGRDSFPASDPPANW